MLLVHMYTSHSTSCSYRRKTAPAGELHPSTSDQTGVSGHTKQPGGVPHSKSESSGSKERSSSVTEEGTQSSTSLTPPVEDSREPPANGAASNDQLGVDCEEQCPRVEEDLSAQTVKQSDPKAPTLQPDFTLKAPEGQNDQVSSDIGANLEVSKDDGQERQDDKATAKTPLSTSEHDVIVEPSRSDIVRTTSSTEDVDASTVQIPLDPLCAANDGNVASKCASVKSLDPDNSDDGIYRVGTTHMATYMCIFNIGTYAIHNTLSAVGQQLHVYCTTCVCIGL